MCVFVCVCIVSEIYVLFIMPKHLEKSICRNPPLINSGRPSLPNTISIFLPKTVHFTSSEKIHPNKRSLIDILDMISPSFHWRDHDGGVEMKQ